MSEEILKALMELFALIGKQDGGVMMREREYVSDFLTKQLNRDSVHEYLAHFDEQAGSVLDKPVGKGSSLTSVRDSVKVLEICKKINRTLTREQKVVVLMRLFELVNADRHFTLQRMNIIITVAEVFNIPQDEFSAIELFVKKEDTGSLKNPAILFLSPGEEECSLCNRLLTGYHDTRIIFLRVASVDLYFIKYVSADQLYLNGLPIVSGNIYTFAQGASLKSQHGHAIYYSDISSGFLSDITINKISFTVENLSFNFREGHTAINNISFSLEERNLIGILGPSGSGKTTLLNLMSGIQKPTVGSIKINGLDVFTDHKKMEGVFGYVPQDDLLIEDLTVFEKSLLCCLPVFSK